MLVCVFFLCTIVFSANTMVLSFRYNHSVFKTWQRCPQAPHQPRIWESGAEGRRLLPGNAAHVFLQFNKKLDALLSCQGLGGLLS